MALWIEAKYAGIVGSRLRNFKSTGHHKWAFSCPFCGDSKKNPRKARGGFYVKKGELNFGCFNGCDGKSFGNFLKEVDSALFDEFRMECLKERGPPPEAELPKPPKAAAPISFTARRWTEDLECITDLPDDHPAHKFIIDRMIPTEWRGMLYFCRRWFEWSRKINPDQKEVTRDEGRIVIPMLDYHLEPIGFQGRSLDGFGPKYLTVIARPGTPLMFGLQRFCEGQKIKYALEGPFDAMFLRHAVAACGGDITADLDQIPEVRGEKADVTVVYDNEKRSIHTVKKMRKAVDAGYSVCVWPDPLMFKDVNNMVQRLVETSDLTIATASDKVEALIDAHTYQGFRATVAINRWSKTFK